MAGKFERKKLRDCCLADSFFDSLKQDYPKFEEWFRGKAKEGEEAFVFEDDKGLCAFVYLKENENEEIKLKNGTLPKADRIKIRTLKLDDRQQGQRLGEGAIGIVLWKWQKTNVDEIYLTVYDTHTDLIALIEKYGFVCKGELFNDSYDENKKELVYVKSKKSINYTTPFTSFPFINSDFDSASMLPIYDDFHDRLLPYSELKNTEQEFWDEAAGNGISKVFIGSPFNIKGICNNNPVFIYRIYRGTDGAPTYKSCITSFGTITKVIVVKNEGKAQMSIDEFIKICGNKTIFDDDGLRVAYKRKNLVIFEFVYNGFFGKGKNVIHKALKDSGLFQTYPYEIRYTREEFYKIVEMGGVNVQDIIIN